LWIIAVIVIGSLIALVILLLAIPFDLAMALDVHGQTQFDLSWGWFFGLVHKKLKFKKRVPETIKPQPQPKPKAGLKKTAARIRSVVSIIKTRGFTGQIIRLIKRTFHQLKIRKMEGDWKIGLDDPYETFYLWALTKPINHLLNNTLHYSINIGTDFSEPGIEGYLTAELRLYPIQLVPPLFQFVFSAPTFRVLKRVLAGRWRRNR